MKPQKPIAPTRKVSRRNFMATAGAATAFTIVPRHVLGGAGFKAPSDKLNIAGIGVGGMGKNNLRQCEAENIVALCDVDHAFSAKVYAKYPKAKVYTDFRKMLGKQKDIDACIIATPDHTHAVIAMAAMQLGKHVYVQKPLTHSIHEARMLTEAARKYGVMTQMGNQGNSGHGTRLIKEWLQSGAIGKVHTVHAWTNRPVWPQGVEVDRPKVTPPVPKDLDWYLWLGPAAFRPYHPTYLPGRWRAWWDFGTGSLGDLGCHILDPVVSALDLKYAVEVEGCISTYWHEFWQKTEPKLETYPRCSIIRFKYPARGDMPAVDIHWYDGGLMPPRPEELEDGRRMGDSDGGLMFIGDKGKMMTGTYGRNPRLIPETTMREFKKPPETLPRVQDGLDGHERDWVRSCKDGKPASSNFEHSGPLTEMVLMGNLAVRYPQKRLTWDGAKMEVTNFPEANNYVKREYREGWSLT